MRALAVLRIATRDFCDRVEARSYPSFSTHVGPHDILWEEMSPTEGINDIHTLFQSASGKRVLDQFKVVLWANKTAGEAPGVTASQDDFDATDWERLSLQMQCAYWKARAHGKTGGVVVDELLCAWSAELLDDMPLPAKDEPSNVIHRDF